MNPLARQPKALMKGEGGGEAFVGSSRRAHLLVRGVEQGGQHGEGRRQNLHRRLRLATTHVAQGPHAVAQQSVRRGLGDVEEQTVQGVRVAQHDVAEFLESDQAGMRRVPSRGSTDRERDGGAAGPLHITSNAA